MLNIERSTRMGYLALPSGSRKRRQIAHRQHILFDPNDPGTGLVFDLKEDSPGQSVLVGIEILAVRTLMPEALGLGTEPVLTGRYYPGPDHFVITRRAFPPQAGGRPLIAGSGDECLWLEAWVGGDGSLTQIRVLDASRHLLPDALIGF